jgi:DNA repair exonuclease SbcCD ATPase subunit
MDESDGDLDATGRVLYLKMIETAHKACNARLSILITHSSELKEIIEQRIEL